MINFTLRLFGQFLKIFGGFFMIVLFLMADWESFFLFLIIFFIPGHYLSRMGVKNSEDDNSFFIYYLFPRRWA